MIRDKRKSKEYFTGYLIEQEERIKKFLDKINSGTLAEDRIAPVTFKLGTLRLGKVYLMYSAGYELTSIKEELEEVIADIKFRNMQNRYTDLLIILSLCVLLDLDSVKVNRIKSMVEEHLIDDFLISFLLRYLFPNFPQSESIIHDSPYSMLVNVINGTESDNEKVLQDYLNNYWFEGHYEKESRNDHNIDKYYYKGYWSFESAAIVKILSLDDTLLRVSDYYPKDLF